MKKKTERIIGFIIMLILAILVLIFFAADPEGPDYEPPVKEKEK